MSDRKFSFSNFLRGLMTGDVAGVKGDYWFRVHALGQLLSELYRAELAEEVGGGWWHFHHPTLGHLEWNFPTACPLEVAAMPFFKHDGVLLLEFRKSDNPDDLLTHVKWVAPAAEALPAETRVAVEKWLGCLETPPPMR